MIKNLLKTAGILLLMMFVGSAWGQTEIFNFAGGGSAPTEWAFTNNVTARAIDQGSYWLVDAGDPSDIIATAVYDLSSYTSAELNLNVATYGSGTAHPAKIEISYDGGSNYVQTLTTNTPSSSTYITGGPIILNSVSDQVVIKISNNGVSGRGVRLQNLVLTASSSSTPTILVSTTSLSGFSYVDGNGPSTEQTFTVEGSNLTNNISIAASTNYEISKSSGTGFTTPLTYTPAQVATPQTVYVRLKAGLSVGNYNSEDIIATSTGASNKTVTCSGAVTAPLPNIIITEVMQNPSDVNDDVGEWFELYNYGATTVDINEYVIKDLGGESHTINNGGSLNISSGSFLVLGINSDINTNGGVPVNYQYSSFNLANGDDEIILYMSDGTTEIDRVEWDGGTSWPDPTGASMTYTGSTAGNNNLGSNWTTATKRENDYTNPLGTETDYGSPGNNGTGQDLVTSTTWSGTGNWSEGNDVGNTNWSDGVPGASTNVSINGTLTVDDLVECNDFTIAPTGQVSVTSGQGLSINGDLLIASTSGGTGSFIYNAGDIDITGTTTVQRYLTNYSAVGDNEYHFISSPVTSQAIQPEFVEDPPLATVDFYKYDEPTNTWINTKLAENGLWNSGFGANFEVGKGYLVAYPTAPVTKSFTGTLNSYTSAAPLEITCTNNNNNGWNLLGNPFPSAIDWDLVTTGDLGDGMDNALYYYDAAAANYRYYIQLSGETGSLGTGSQYIPSGQGFMVHAQSAGTKTVTLYEDQQTHSTQSFYKNTHSLANLLELKLANDGKEDETTLFFYPEATNGFDGSYDAYKLYSYAVDMPQIYSIINSNTRLAINSMGSIAENPTVQMGFRIQKAGEHTLNASGTENFDLSASIILEDTYLNKMHDFKTAGDYTFASETGDFTDRFIMHFGVVGIDESPELNQINAYVYNNSLYVQSQLDNAQMSLYDIQGRQMLTEQLNGTGLHSTELNLPTGIYIVRLQSNNQVKNVKVFIN